MTATASYAQSYRELSQSAEKLRTLPPEDIDELVGLVETATQAHRACKERLASVRALVEEKLRQGDEPA